METGTLAPVHLEWLDALARLSCSVLFALAIGIERFVHRKPVDFRPFAIISLASCALAIAILELGYRSSDPHLAVDPAKVMSGVMTGIGFLGAGALFRERRHVQGAGSATAIWAAGAIGIVCGIGFLWLAAIVAVVVMAVLLAGRRVADDYTISVRDADEDQP